MSVSCHNQICAPPYDERQLATSPPLKIVRLLLLLGRRLLDSFRNLHMGKGLSMAQELFDQSAWLKRIGYAGPLEPTRMQSRTNRSTSC